LFIAVCESVGADLRVCPGGYLYIQSGADTQVRPYRTCNRKPL